MKKRIMQDDLRRCRNIITVSVMGVCGLLGASCNQNVGSATPTSSPTPIAPAALERQVKAIEENPRIKPEMKTQLISMLKNQGKSQGPPVPMPTKP